MRYIAILIVSFAFFDVYAQNPIGFPKIITYGNLEYRGGTQNWDIDQDENGILYFANNEGLLTFDGRHWKLYSLPHRTIVRSVKIDRAGKIYVGAQDEIGFFYPEKNGTLKFNSLKNLIPERDRQFSDIWDIFVLKNDVFFRANDRIFHLRDGVMRVYRPEGQWEFMGRSGGRLIAQDLRGIMAFQHGVWQVIARDRVLEKDHVTSVMEYGRDTLLVTTLKNGLYLMGNDFFTRQEGASDPLFRKHRIYSAVRVSKDWFAVASYSGGCYIINKNGEIQQHFSSAEGLYMNNLRSIFMDRNRNLWLGLDDGINFIAFNNAIKYIYPDKEKQTSSYSAIINNKTLYIGTSNGIYSNLLTAGNPDLSYSKRAFKEIKNTSGQVWSLREINNRVLAGHEDAALVISGDEASAIYSQPGTWLFEPLSLFYPVKDIIAGTYNGLQLIEFNKGAFLDRGPVQGISETLRFLLYDNNSVWASHPYRGIYRFRLSADHRKIIDKKLYTEQNGLPSSLGNYIAKIKNRIVIATQKGIYEFDERSDRFVPSVFLNPILKNRVYHYLKEDGDGNIWFISYKKVGVVDFRSSADNKKYSIVYFPELNSQVVAGFENIYPYNNENVFIGSTKGLIHINYKKYLKNLRALDVILSSVKASGKNDSIIHGGYFLRDGGISKVQDGNNVISLSKEYNSLHFEYSSSLYEQQHNIEFSYQLVGFDSHWSDWSGKSEKDYTNLPHGDYTFRVKSRNNLGNESASVSFSFVIKPAWYETFWIYLLCLICLVGFVVFLTGRQKKKYLKEQEYFRSQYLLEIEHNEKEIVKLQNEKLEAEVNFKNKELATTSMHLAQKGQLLSKIKEELQPLLKLDPAPSDELKKVFRLLNEAERSDSEWEQFAVHFDHVHSNFLKKLKERFPALSSNDLKLCAYLKMNLTSKEIAQLMSITIRGVEVSRYRLRKKLQVSSDTNLFDYLLQVTEH